MVSSKRPTVVVVQHDSDSPVGLIGDVLRRQGLELRRWSPGDRLDPAAVGGVVVLGGAAHPDGAQSEVLFGQERLLIREAGRADLPVLGICLGAQLLAQAYGGDVYRLERPELGWTDVVLSSSGPGGGPFAGCPSGRYTVLQWHYFGIAPPPNAVVLARNAACVQAFRSGRHAWGLQFHVEVTESIVRGWIGDGRELVAAGRDPDPRRMLIDERFAEQARLARAVAVNFAERVGAAWQRWHAA